MEIYFYDSFNMIFVSKKATKIWLLSKIWSFLVIQKVFLQLLQGYFYF